MLIIILYQYFKITIIIEIIVEFNLKILDK